MILLPRSFIVRSPCTHWQSQSVYHHHHHNNIFNFFDVRNVARNKHFLQKKGWFWKNVYPMKRVRLLSRGGVYYTRLGCESRGWCAVCWDRLAKFGRRGLYYARGIFLIFSVSRPTTRLYRGYISYLIYHYGCCMNFYQWSSGLVEFESSREWELPLARIQKKIEWAGFTEIIFFIKFTLFKRNFDLIATHS